MRYINRKTAASYVCCVHGVPMSAARLADLACRGTGPRYVIINGKALYLRSELDQWIAEQAARPIIRRRDRGLAAAVQPGDGVAREEIA